METICTSCMNTDISFQEGARPASLCYKHGCFVALGELITECADFDPNPCWWRQRVKELEAQLASKCAACPDLGMAALVERLQREQVELLKELAWCRKQLKWESGAE